ncbi:hypothetical protein KIJ05_08155 [Leuconostoc gelidum subsp. gasicomitatum]|uniref:hypothetical protein n=1 Tax=Leuconostoc gasicomitatum TaxID=115778 RepID=UPI001CC39EEA|nr:hypothetical protein [Leuconostoc gasicomitatum]
MKDILKNKVKPTWIAGGVGIIVVLAIIIIAVLPKGLNGSYTGNVEFLFMKTKDTLKFSGDSVTEIDEDGTVSNKGTYKISGHTLEMKIGNYNMTAELSDDKKSFVVKSADGMAGLANGTKYTKK